MTDSQLQRVYNALLNGSKYSNIEGCIMLRMGCYQRIISFLRNDYGLPIRDINVTNKTGNGQYKKYYFADEIRYELRKANANTPRQAREYYTQKMIAFRKQIVSANKMV